MSFTDGKPVTVTEEHLKIRWGGRDPSKCPFRCYMCGNKFEVGGTFRFVYSNGVEGAGGNPLVCADCDGPNWDVVERWKAMRHEARTKFWWFTYHGDCR